jgi:hypothetical protein
MRLFRKRSIAWMARSRRRAGKTVGEGCRVRSYSRCPALCRGKAKVGVAVSDTTQADVSPRHKAGEG